MKIFSLRITDELAKKLEKEANKTGLTIAALIRMLLTIELNKKDK